MHHNVTKNKILFPIFLTKIKLVKTYPSAAKLYKPLRRTHAHRRGAQHKLIEVALLRKLYKRHTTI